MLDWHFARPALAEHYLGNLFDHGLPRLALFGRRRIGKSAFLQHDLMPAARAKGVQALYCSFWENLEQPQQAWIRMLDGALAGKTWQPRLRMGIQSGVLDLSAEVARAERPQAAQAGELAQAVERFEAWQAQRKGRPALLLLDEIQHLATASQFASFAATLRTVLDMAGPGLRVLFTGSSHLDLQRLFDEQRAPFFNFAAKADFPVLDSDFLRFLQARHQQITGLQLPLAPLEHIFTATACNAQLISGLVQKLVLLRSDDWETVWREQQDELLGDAGWCERQWAQLAPSDRTVYLQLLAGAELFSEASLALYAQQGFSRGTAQQAIKRLLGRGLLLRTGHGRYERAMPLFDAWLRARGLVPAA